MKSNSNTQNKSIRLTHLSAVDNTTPPVSSLMKPAEVREAIKELAVLPLDAIGEAMALKDLKALGGLPISSLRAQLQEEKERLLKIDTLDARTAIEITETERDLAKTLAAKQDLFSEFHAAMKVFGFPVERYFTDAILCMLTGRLLDHGTGWVFTGPSSSGKSDIPRTAIALLPDEQKYVVTGASQKALYYLGDVKNKVLGFGEIKNRKGDEKDSEVQEAARQLISEGSIKRSVVEPQETGPAKVTELVTEGPAAFTFSTTAEPDTFCDELVNRCFWIPADTTPETNRLALDAIAHRAELDGISETERKERERLQEIWQAFFKCQTPQNVAIPYASKITPEATCPASKRLFKQLLDLVRISAMLHRHNRKEEYIDCVLTVFAEEQDYRLAYGIASKICPRPEGAEKIGTREAYQSLEKHFPPGYAEFTQKDAETPLGLGRTATQDRLKDMVALEWCMEVGGKPKRYRLNQNIDQASLGLVHPNSINWTQIAANLDRH